MSAHVVLNLLNELEKRNKCEACNDTGGRMLDSIILYYIKTTLKSHIWRKNIILSLSLLLWAS